MAHDKVFVGQFIRRRAADPDDSEDTLAPGGVLVAAKSALEQDLPNSDLRIGPSHASGGQLAPGRDVIARLTATDERIKGALLAIDSEGKFAAYVGAPVNTPGDLEVDPSIFAKNVARLGRHLGASGLALFAATQVGFFAANRRGRVWNPLTAAPPPIVRDFSPAALDVALASGAPEPVRIDRLVDLSLERGSAAVRKSLKETFFTEGFKIQIESGFARGVFGGAGPADPLVRATFNDGVVPAAIEGENRFGFATHRRGGEPAVQDDASLVPLSFTDLRPVGNVYRTVYFRPFIDSLSEDFAPEWNEQRYFGRPDPVVTYQSTGRTVSLAFRLAAFRPEDVRTIYQKIGWLASMVYPELDKDLTYRSGPAVRMRVGDVLNAVGPEGARGLPGVIRSLSHEYSESIWELKRGFKVPRHVRVSLSFLVLHDRPIGLGAEGKFGGLGRFDVDGKFLPPAARGARAAGAVELPTPEVQRGASSFRAVGGDRADELLNGYESLATADGE